MKKILKKYLIYITAFLIFFFIETMSPLSGDDWGNYISSTNNIITNFNSSLNMYFTWEGRIVSRFLIYTLATHKIIFNIITAIFLTILVYAGNKIINKKIIVLPIMAILLVNVTMFAQTYTWMAGVITYLYPTVITLLYFTYLLKKKTFKFKKLELLVLMIINIITPMFVENIGLAFVFGNVLYIIFNRKENKQELIKFIIISLFSLISIILMLLSPGSAIRMAQNGDFNNLNIIGKVLSNIPNFITFTFTINIVCLTLMTLVILKSINNIKLKILFCIIPLLGVIQNIYMMIPIELNLYRFTEMFGYFQVDNWYFIFFWLFFGLLFLNIVRKDKYPLFFTLIAIFSNLVMLATPVWGERTAFFTIIILMFVSLRLLEINNKKLITILFSLLTLYYIIIFSLIGILQHDRENYISKQLNNSSKNIYIYENFISYIWSSNPGIWSNNQKVEYHVKVFKWYYNIDDNKTLVYKAHGIKKILGGKK